MFEYPSVTVIPAAPGWHVSVLYHGAEQLADEPIVAWEVARQGQSPVDGPDRFVHTLAPICTNNRFNNKTAPVGAWLLRDPTGRYRDPGGNTFDDANHAFTWLKTRLQHLTRAWKAAQQHSAPNW